MVPVTPEEEADQMKHAAEAAAAAGSLTCEATDGGSMVGNDAEADRTTAEEEERTTAEIKEGSVRTDPSKVPTAATAAAGGGCSAESKVVLTEVVGTILVGVVVFEISIQQGSLNTYKKKMKHKRP